MGSSSAEISGPASTCSASTRGSAAPPASAQGTQGATQTPTPAAPQTTPAATPGGRGGRGGIAGPLPAFGGEVDETPVVTRHSITVQGNTLNYTATVAQMPLKDS